MEIALVAVVGTLNIVCFFIGAKVGQAVVRGEKIEAPVVKGPMTLIKEHRDHKEAEAEKNRLDVIMRNIERYDGTGNGQEDVPRG